MSTLLEAVDKWLEDRARRLKVPRSLLDTALQRGALQCRFATGISKQERELER